jgi:hypothetical protein
MDLHDEKTELRKIIARLETVERENHNLKRIVLTIVLLVSTVLLMGQVHPNRIVEAEKFVLKDASGTTRARMDIEAGGPTVALLDDRGFPLVSLHAGDSPTLMLCGEAPPLGSGILTACDQQVQIGRFSKEQFGIALYGKDEGGPYHGFHAGFGVRGGVPGLDLWGKDGSEHASLDLDAPGPSLILSDKQGFTTTIGSSDLKTPRTGEEHRTSAASIVLSGKDHSVLWSAP